MYPDDRVLVGVMPDPRDLDIARERHWYRVPEKSLPNGVQAEYVAFYFTKKYGDDLRWAIHFFAKRTGHKLVHRIDLFPEQPEHPRAHERYYQLQLADLRQKSPPIVSKRWRRITFINTTWDRFVNATEVNDLFSTDSVYVDRAYKTLRARGIVVDRAIEVKQKHKTYLIDIVIPCRKGTVFVSGSAEAPPAALMLGQDEDANLASIEAAIARCGGPIMADAPL